MRLHMIFRAGLVLSALISPVAAQDKLPALAPAAQKVLAAASPQQLQVPPAEQLVLLIRLSLLTLNDAIQTGNYTVLRDRGGPSFRQTNSAAKLSRIFASLEAQRPDLAVVATMVPQLDAAEIAGPEQRLRVKGTFPGQRERINFELILEPAEGQWQLFGLSVGASPVPHDAPVAQKPAPQKPAAKK